MIGWRDLTRLGRIVAGLIVVGAVIVVMALASHTWSNLTDWLPWSGESQLERAEAERDHLQADLDARDAQVSALERQSEQTAAAYRTLTEARAVIARATTQAEAAPDANDPIDPARADRLRAADRRLCQLSPDLCRSARDHPAATGA